jgi:hypothetical protein
LHGNIPVEANHSQQQNLPVLTKHIKKTTEIKPRYLHFFGFSDKAIACFSIVGLRWLEKKNYPMGEAGA